MGGLILKGGLQNRGKRSVSRAVSCGPRETGQEPRGKGMRLGKGKSVVFRDSKVSSRERGGSAEDFERGGADHVGWQKTKPAKKYL